MRKWLVVAAIIVLALGVASVLAVSRFKTYVSERQDRVAAELSAALRRSVTFEDISISLRGGLSASVSNLQIAEDPQFGAGDFIHVKRAHIVIRLLPALFGNYEIREIQLDSPVIRIIKDSSRFNFESIASDGKEGTPGDGTGGGAETPSRSEAVALLVALLQIADGQLSFTDRTAEPPTTIEIDALAAAVTGASLTSPITLNLSAQVLGSKLQNLAVTGRVGPIGDRRDPGTIPLELQARLGPLSLDDLERGGLAASIPASLSVDQPITADLTAAGTIADLSGSLSIDATDAGVTYGDLFLKPASMPLRLTASFRRIGQQLRFDPATLYLADADFPGTATLSWGTTPALEAALHRESLPLGEWIAVIPKLASLDLSGAADIEMSADDLLTDPPQVLGKIGLRNAGLSQPGIRVTELTSDVLVQPRRITASSTQLKVNGSPVEAKAAYELEHERFSVDLHARGIDLKPILEAYAPKAAEQMDGKVDADAQLNGRGLEPEAVRRSLAGSGRVAVKDGVLRNLNIGEAVLTGATGVGGLTQLISPSTREKYPGLLRSADTFFEALGASFRIADGVVATEDLHVVAEHYELNGRGTVSLQNRIDMHAVFLASEGLTADLTKEVKPTKYLKNADGRLEIPFELKGAWPKVRPKADESALLETLGRSKLGERLSELLGGKKNRDATPAPETDLIRKGLDRLFGQ